MALQLAIPPPNAYDLVAQAISRVSTAGGAADAVVNVSDPSRLSAALPHKVYTLGSNDIARGRNVDRARLIAWRFLIQNGSKTIAAIKFTCNPLGQNLRFASLDTGPFAQATRDMVAMAEGLDSVRRNNYELCLLEVPSVYAMALWLKNLNGTDDIIIPIQVDQAKGGPKSEGGMALPQSPRSFMQELRPVAAANLDVDTRPTNT